MTLSTPSAPSTPSDARTELYTTSSTPVHFCAPVSTAAKKPWYLTAQAAAKREMIRQYPEWKLTAPVGALRKTEFAKLDKAGEVYLDYGGAGQPMSTAVKRSAKQLMANVYGNTHSLNASAVRSMTYERSARANVLRFFKTDAAEHEAIFTSGAT